MATNPMQRKSRNSFLLGMLVTLIITGLIIALLFMQLTNLKKQEKKEKDSYVEVYTIQHEIKSGEEITVDNLVKVKTAKNARPTNAIEPSSLGIKNIAKIDLQVGTVISSDMIYIDETATRDDLRKQEYNTIILPLDLTTGDYIDVRLSLPSGQDLIVVSKKIVEVPIVDGVNSVDTVWMDLTEEETLAMSNAIYDAFKISGSKLYATKYTEPGLQTAAQETYPVNAEIQALIKNNPNIITQAKNALIERYNKNNLLNIRDNYINNAISEAGDAAQSQVETGIKNSITNSQETRKEYLESLTGN